MEASDAHWVLKAMVAVAGADGRLNAREVGLIQKVYEDETGRSVDASTPPAATSWQSFPERREA